MKVHDPQLDGPWRMLSQTAEYALRVVLHIAAKPSHEATSAAGAAAELGIPERYLARVLNALARAGVLYATRGAHGGFRLALPAAELDLARVVAPFDAVGDAPQCLLRDQLCGQGAPCIAHQRWHDVSGRIRRFFQQTTVADLITSTALSATAR